MPPHPMGDFPLASAESNSDSEKLTRSSSGVVVSGNGVICDDGDNDTAFELE